MTKRGRLLATLLVLLAPVATSAQEFPAKPIRLIVPFPPGGPNDIIARVIGQKMSELTKQPIIVDNRAGQVSGLRLPLAHAVDLERARRLPGRLHRRG